MLLPQELPRIPNFEVAAYSRSSQIVGRYYFDFVRFGNGHQGLMIADVAGHGVSASMLVASLQAFLRTITPTNRGGQGHLVRAGGTEDDFLPSEVQLGHDGVADMLHLDGGNRFCGIDEPLLAHRR